MMNINEVVEKMANLNRTFSAECEDIARQCEEEGLPSYGSTYDLRCSEIWHDYYEDDMDYLYDYRKVLEGDDLFLEMLFQDFIFAPSIRKLDNLQEMVEVWNESFPDKFIHLCIDSNEGIAYYDCMVETFTW